MPTPTIELTPDNLRASLAPGGNPFNFSAERLTAEINRVADEGRAILNSGSTLASDDRRAKKIADHLGLLTDVVNAQKATHAKNAARIEARQAEAARIRVADGDGDMGNRGRFDLGASLRDAIGEVREGRASAFVELPQMSNTLTTAGTGGYAVPMEIRSPIETMRAMSIVMSLPGIRVESMASDRVRWPRLSQATVSEVAETATLPDAATDIDAVDVVAAKFGSLQYLSTELEEDLSSAALTAIGQNLVKSLATKVDLGLLEGTGAGPGIVGIRNTVGVNSTSLAATPTNFVKFRDAEYELALDNGSGVVWVLHPRTWKTLAGIKTGISSDETTLLEPDPQQGPRTLLGYPVATSSQITLTEGAGAGSWAALLDTSQIVVCERRPARLEVSRDVAFDSDRLAIRCTWRGGLAVLNPEAVSLVTDIRA